MTEVVLLYQQAEEEADLLDQDVVEPWLLSIPALTSAAKLTTCTW